MIDSYLVAYDFGEGVREYAKKVGIRKYTIGRRPHESREWSNLNLIIYKFDNEDYILKFNSY